MREHICPGCDTKTNILHGNKVLCSCGILSDMEGNALETRMKTVKPFSAHTPMLDSKIAGGIHPKFEGKLMTSRFNFTTPDEKTVEYYIQEDAGNFIIYSKAFPINRDGTGCAHNFVAEKSSMEAAEELVDRLEKL